MDTMDIFNIIEPCAMALGGLAIGWTIRGWWDRTVQTSDTCANPWVHDIPPKAAPVDGRTYSLQPASPNRHATSNASHPAAVAATAKALAAVQTPRAGRGQDRRS